MTFSSLLLRRPEITLFEEFKSEVEKQRKAECGRVYQCIPREGGGRGVRAWPLSCTSRGSGVLGGTDTWRV